MKHFRLLLLILLMAGYQAIAQDTVFKLFEKGLFENGSITLSDQPNWRFQRGNDLTWANPKYDDKQWDTIKPKRFFTEVNENGVMEGCFRFTFLLDSALASEPKYLRIRHYGAARVFVNGQEIVDTDYEGRSVSAFQPTLECSVPQLIHLIPQQSNVIVVYLKEQRMSWLGTYTYMNLSSPLHIEMGTRFYKAKWTEIIKRYQIAHSANIAGLILLTLLFWALVLQNPNENQFVWIALITTLMMFDRYINSSSQLPTILTYPIYKSLWDCINFLWVALIPIVMSQLILKKTSAVAKWLFITGIIFRIITIYFSGISFAISNILFGGILSIAIIGYFIFLVVTNRTQLNKAQWVAAIGLLLSLIAGATYEVIQFSSTDWSLSLGYISIITFLTFPVSLLVYISLRLKENIETIQKNILSIAQLSAEKQHILSTQNELLERQVEARTAELKASQNQLIQKEKLASLGELTAGIAHEIQNPLNFVNNFSEVSSELVDEMQEELKVGNADIAIEIAGDLRQNLEKINHHGKRASSIVKGMLEHSRMGTGERVLADINALCDEYLRLSYHGMRAKNHQFNADFELVTDPNLPRINVIPQDIGRVLLNLINNAFYAVNQRRNLQGLQHLTGLNTYQPKVTVTTKASGNAIEIKVQDNGTGMSEATKTKIFQPFFTTKPTGEGTGLGLSLAYDIVTKGHGGTVEVETKEGEGKTFTIQIPI